MERTGSRPTRFTSVAARGDKMRSDVQTGGVMFPKRKAKRIPTDKIHASAFKVRAKPARFKEHQVVVK